MDLEAIYQRGFEFRCSGQYAEAKAEFQKVLAADPGHVDARLQNALILGFEGDFDGSLAALTQLSNQHPQNDDVRCELAMTQMMLWMYEEGCANFKAILARNPNHEKALQQSAYC